MAGTTNKAEGQGHQSPILEHCQEAEILPPDAVSVEKLSPKNLLLESFFEKTVLEQIVKMTSDKKSETSRKSALPNTRLQWQVAGSYRLRLYGGKRQKKLPKEAPKAVFLASPVRVFHSYFQKGGEWSPPLGGGTRGGGLALPGGGIARQLYAKLKVELSS